MIIVLTPEESMDNEIHILHQLFEAGLQRYHIRKHWLAEAEMKVYLKNINSEYQERLVLHSHHELATDYGITRLHFREEDRKTGKHMDYIGTYTLSTSVHDIHAFNSLHNDWDYAFLSPVYQSISKQGYGNEHTVLNTFAARKNQHTKLIGLGGVDATNCLEVKELGADGIALLGGIWQATDPLKEYRKIQTALNKSER